MFYLFALTLMLYEFLFLILLRHLVLGFLDTKREKPLQNPFDVPPGHLIRNTTNSQKLLSDSTQNIDEPFSSLISHLSAGSMKLGGVIIPRVAFPEFLSGYTRPYPSNRCGHLRFFPLRL